MRSDQPWAAAYRPQPLRRNRWIISAVLAAVLLVCCGLPVAGGVAWLLHGTVKASAGAPYPGVALIDFMHDAWDPLGDPDQLIKVLCDKRQDALPRQVADYRTQLEAFTCKENTSWKFTLGFYSAQRKR
jgi:hypothetical protein